MLDLYAELVRVVEALDAARVEGPDFLPVDLVLPVEPDLAASLEDRTSMSVEGRPVWVVGLRSLRRLKRLRGSPLDRVDLEALGPEQ